MHQLSVEDRFHSELIQLPRDAQKKVLRALGELQRDPFVDSKQLQGVDGVFRKKAHPYRILFTTADGWVHVYSVQHRSSVYRGKVRRPKNSPSGGSEEFPTWDEIAPDPAVDRSGWSGYETTRGPEAVTDYGQAWDSIEQLVLTQDPQALYELIDFGLPAPMFDSLYNALSTRAPRRAHGPENVRLVRRDVVDSFFGPLLRMAPSDDVQELTVVSPWITPWDGRQSSFDGFLRWLKRFDCPCRIVTRPPEFDSHDAAVSLLAESPAVELTFLRELHAKYFVCDLAPVPFALIGSANSTHRSFSNLEIGVYVRGTGETEGIVRDLQGHAIELRATGLRRKKIG